MIDVRDVRGVLVQRVEDVCRLLLPAGKRDGDRWVVGDWDGVAGTSLVVELDGALKGEWRDWKPNNAEGEKGDLIGLWMHRRKVGFRKALEEAWGEFGIAAAPGEGWKKAGVEGPERLKGGWILGEIERLKLEMVLPGDTVDAWLREKHKVAGDFVGIMQRKNGEGVEICFEYRNAAGELASVRCVDVKTGAGWVWPERPERWVLFGSDGIGADKDLTIVRSELDVMALEMFGRRGVAMPTVTGRGDKFAWMDDQGEWLAGFDRIYFAFGMKSEERPDFEKLAARLGEDRVRCVVFPDGHGSVSECLVHGLGRDDLDGAFAQAREMGPERLVRPDDVRDKILDLYFPEKRGVDEGDEFPWTFPMGFRPGEITVWQGYTGSGKTQVLNNCLVYWAREKKRRYCVASLEVDAADTFWYQGRIWAGKRKPEDETEFNRQLVWLNEWGSAYYHVGVAPLDDILRIWEYEAKRRGAWHFVLDSLMRVAGIKGDDYDGQKAVCDALIEFARRFKVHCHLVCHSKKPDQRHPVEKCWPSKYDISGSAALANLPHNIVCVWRNKGKEDALFEAQFMPDKTDSEAEEKQILVRQWENREDTLLIVQKQRMTGDEGEKRLWFEGASCRFRQER